MWNRVLQSRDRRLSTAAFFPPTLPARRISANAPFRPDDNDTYTGGSQKVPAHVYRASQQKYPVFKDTTLKVNAMAYVYVKSMDHVLGVHISNTCHKRQRR